MGKSSASVPGHERGAAAAAPPRGRMEPWVAGGVWLALVIVMLAPLPKSYLDTAGDSSAETIITPSPLLVPDEVATKAERARLNERHMRIWNYQTGALERGRDRLRRAFDLLITARPASGSDLEELSADLLEKAGLRITARDLASLYKLTSPEQFSRNLGLAMTRTLQGKFVVANKELFTAHTQQFPDLVEVQGLPEDLRRLREQEALAWPDEARRHFREIELRPMYPSGEERPLIEIGAEILCQVVEPDLEFNQAATKQRLAESVAALEVKPIQRPYVKDELVVRRDETISPTQSLAIAQINLLLREAYPYRLIGIALLTVLCFCVAGFFLRRLRGEASLTAGNISLMALPLMITIIAGRFAYALDFIPDSVRFTLFPSALAGMLATIALGAQVGFVMVIIAALLFEAAAGLGIDFLVLALLGGFTAVISLQRLRERRDVLIAGLRVGAVNMAAVCVLGLFRTPVSLDLPPVVWALVNGSACAWVTLPLLVIFERAFGIVTDMRLLELTGPQHPLIRMMEEKTPGTFEHTHSVTKLAEAGAEAIGANQLLVRTGAIFHDIGKMMKPKYFTENQVTLEDKKLHGKLTPYMSTLIIKNHVKEGIELARKHGLPQKVIDFIPQHHGTGLIRYFYFEATKRYQESDSARPVREEEFRYPGPKPQSVEAGIVMLADSVEAIVTATFTQSKVNENDMRRIITKAISDKFDDGQFDECDITLRDLYQIREAFIHLLKARFHNRIAYPGQQVPPSQQPRREREAAAAGAKD